MPILESVRTLHNRAVDPGLAVRQGAEGSEHWGDGPSNPRFHPFFVRLLLRDG
jgi:hypothetical protein